MSSQRPRIDLVASPRNASDLILFAHGGLADSTDDPHAWRGPILRMWPFAAAAKQVDRSALVGLIRYRYRGWNGTAADPSADLRLVLDRLPAQISRVVLIGHSMGGRAVVAQGNHPKVVGVLGQAPGSPKKNLPPGILPKSPLLTPPVTPSATSPVALPVVRSCSRTGIRTASPIRR